MANYLIVSADRSIDAAHSASLGDEFLTVALADELTHRGHAVRVADFGELSDRPYRSNLGGLGPLYSAIRLADAVVIGGGTMLQHESHGILRSGLPRLVAVTSSIAKRLGKRVLYFGVGCDPIDDSWSRVMLSYSLRGCDVWVRDEASAANVLSSLRQEAAVAADLALLRLGTEPIGGSQIGDYSVWALAHPEAAMVVPDDVRSDERCVFVSMHQRPSDADCHSLSPAVRTKVQVLGEAQTSEYVLNNVIGLARYVVASRVHALYLALIAGRPMIAVGNRPKVRYFADEFGVPRVASTHELRDVSPELANPTAVEEARLRLNRALDRAFGSNMSGRR